MSLGGAKVLGPPPKQPPHAGAPTSAQPGRGTGRGGPDGDPVAGIQWGCLGSRARRPALGLCNPMGGAGDST